MTKLRLPSASMVVALVALMVALGGTSYAAFSLPKNSVGSKQLKRNAVSTSKIKNGAITAGKIKNGALTAGKIGNGAVTSGKIGNGAVTSGKIGNGAVTTGKIENGAVTADKINSAGLTVPNAQSANSASNASKLGGQPPSAYALSAQPGYTLATLNSSYKPLGFGYSEPGYLKDSLGYVHLTGAMYCPPDIGSVFTLPAGYRPADILFLPLAVGVSGAGNLTILPNGQVETYNPNGAAEACGIDGLVFKAAG